MHHSLRREPHWKAVEWQYRMTNRQLEAHAAELNNRAQQCGERQDWDNYNDCRNALFIVRGEQRRRRNV